MTRLWKPLATLPLLLIPLAAGDGSQAAPPDYRAPDERLRFTVTADMRHHPRGFRRVLRQIAARVGGPGDFHISPGDVDPPWRSLAVLDEVFGPEIPWYVAVGNHDVAREDYREWARELFGHLPDVTRVGPVPCEETTYAFERGPAHFVVLNEYCDVGGDAATDGDILNLLYDWLERDLRENRQPYVFVFGHEPAFPQPDASYGDSRHRGDSLDEHPAHRDRFARLLEREGVTALICGHTHRYSRMQRGGVWHIDVAQARGEPFDAFLNVVVTPEQARFEAWRDVEGRGRFSLAERWTAAPRPRGAVDEATTRGTATRESPRPRRP